MSESLQLLTFVIWKRPGFPILWLWLSDLEPQLQIYQQRQVKWSKRIERLLFYHAALEQSLTERFQFLHYPRMMIVKMKASYTDKTNICPLKSQIWQILVCFIFLRWIIVRRGFLLSLILPKLLFSDWLRRWEVYCTQKQRQEQNTPYQDKWLMIGGLVTSKNCNLFSTTRTSLLCFQVVRSREKSQISPGVVFLCFAGFFWGDLLWNCT